MLQKMYYNPLKLKKDSLYNFQKKKRIKKIKTTAICETLPPEKHWWHAVCQYRNMLR